nr:FAD/NAD(P)-binding protein [Mycobacterium asiaticum]
MPRTSAPPMFDLAFIGSGIATSMTLLEIAQGLQAGRPTKLRIAVVERDDQFWCGIPYGRRSSVRSLAIQKLDEFIHEPERSAYIAWLEHNKHRWLPAFQVQGGDAAARWISDNRAALDANQWGELYLPRNVFGIFIAEQVAAAVAALEELNVAEVMPIHAEAISIRAVDGRFVIGLSSAGPNEIIARKVVVAVGSPPPKTLWTETAPAPFTYLNDLYSPDGESNMARLRDALARVEVPEQRNVLIVGSNATSLEALYLLRHDARIRGHLDSVTVISRSGLLPYPIFQEPPDFDFPRLNAVVAAKAVDAAGLMAAIRADLETAEHRSLNIADLYDGIGALVGQALGRMDPLQQEEFHCVHGMNYTKLVRRAGRDCRQAADELAAEGKLTMLAGDVVRVAACTSGRPVATVLYRTPEGERRHPKTFAAVLNCGGFEDLDACSSPLLVSMTRSGLCRPNRTNRGVLVNDEFEASPGLHVIGPLVGGNFNSTIRFWHVESAPRIRSLAKLLAPSLITAHRYDGTVGSCGTQLSA